MDPRIPWELVGAYSGKHDGTILDTADRGNQQYCSVTTSATIPYKLFGIELGLSRYEAGDCPPDV